MKKARFGGLSLLAVALLLGLYAPFHGRVLNWLRADSDGDGIINIKEVINGTAFNDRDTDHDSIEDGDEKFVGTSPTDPDTDSDGIDDASDPYPTTPATGYTPSIRLRTPAPGSVVATSPVLVEFEVAADRTVNYVWVNARSVKKVGGLYSISLDFDDGPNYIYISADTVEGRTTKLSMPITVDAKPPSLVIASPADKQVVQGSYVYVRALAEIDDATVTINGNPTVRDGFYYNAWVKLASAGSHSITAHLTSPAGEESGNAITVQFNPPPGWMGEDADGDGVLNKDDFFPRDSSQWRDDNQDGEGDTFNAGREKLIITSPQNGQVIYAR